MKNEKAQEKNILVNWECIKIGSIDVIQSDLILTKIKKPMNLLQGFLIILLFEFIFIFVLDIRA